MYKSIVTPYNWKPGKNFTNPPTGIVIHAMMEKLDEKYAPQFLFDLGISAHAFIAPSGMVILGVEDDHIAYHAGKSKHKNLKYLNNYYLGVEVLVPGTASFKEFKRILDEDNWCSDTQVSATAELVAEWVNKYGISLENIVKHSEVSGPDVRSDPKFDPGNMFPWETFISRVNVFLGNLL